MFGPIGGPEFLIILVLALVLFGPRKLPQIGKSLGKALAEFRSATNEFRSSLERDVEHERTREDRSTLAEVGREVKDAVRGVARSDGGGEDHGDSGGERSPRS